MSTTLVLDATGNLLLPAAILADADLCANATVEVTVSGKAILVSPTHAAPHEETRLERRGGRLVFVGGAPFDAVAAIQAERDAREAVLTRAILSS